MIASRALARPIIVAALALLIVNDHVLKAAYPGLVTGKLSDVCGLVFFPLLLAAAAEQVGLRRGMKAIVIAVITTGLVFAAIKLWQPAAELYRVGLAVLQWPFRAGWAVLAGRSVPPIGRVQFVVDHTDLVALVALAMPLLVARRCQEDGIGSELRSQERHRRCDRGPRAQA